MDFASSVPDFRRSDKGNIRHRLADTTILMVSVPIILVSVQVSVFRVYFAFILRPNVRTV